MANHEIKKLLIANRGEIACRISRTAQKMGIPTVGVYTDEDAQEPHAQGEAILITSYLNIKEIIDAAKQTGANAIHPGYGFLSENPALSQACEEAGLLFIGPTPETLVLLGEKAQARETAKKLGIPIPEGWGPLNNPEEVLNAIKKLGFPAMLKAAAGGGGKGMRTLTSSRNLKEEVESAMREAESAFGDARLLVERYVYPARHVEVQIMGDGKTVVVLGERECSLQRRHQKIIEETPAPTISEKLRTSLFQSARKLAEHVGYRSAGTVEFLVAPDESFFFLEVNARLQVEHPVTEMVTGLDLVQLQLAIAQGEPLPRQDDIRPKGHAIEARLNAEEPYRDFLPSPGPLLKTIFPENIPHLRVDWGLRHHISERYDPLIAKIIAWGNNREEARQTLLTGLEQTVVLGVETNQTFLIQLLSADFFINGETYTTTLQETNWGERPVPDILAQSASAVFAGEFPQKTKLPQPLHRWRLG